MALSLPYEVYFVCQTMDNLTHSLVGALLGQMGLKRKTGLAMPTLIFAANIPDIDVAALLLGGHQHLAIRRGITHGPIAMVMLPLLLWGAMIWFDNWQTKRGKRPARRLHIHKGWLLMLAYIGCLSHPLFDWFNSYGIRLFEPFSNQWFYGDTLFIIDVWILAALISGVWLSLRREKLLLPKSRDPALAAFVVVLAYINLNAGISRTATAQTREAILKNATISHIDQIVANPVPFAFWRREIIFGSPNNYYRTHYSNFDSKPVDVKVVVMEVSKHAQHIVDIEKLAAKNIEFAAFLFWSRMPVDAVTVNDGQRFATIRDARFFNPLVADRFSVTMPLTGYEGTVSPAQAVTCCKSLDK